MAFGLPEALAVSAGASALGGIISSAFNSKAQSDANQTNLQAVRETNQANLDLYREQFQDASKLYHEQQYYNSPQYQVAALKQAGLNPALAYSHNSSIGSPSLPSAAPMQAGHVEPVLNNYGDVLGNTVNDFVRNYMTMQQAQGQNIDNQIRSATAQAEIGKAMVDLYRAKLGIKYDSYQNMLIEKNIAMLGRQMQLFDDTRKYQVEAYELQNDLTRQQRYNLIAQESEALAQRDYLDVAARLGVHRDSREALQLKASLAMMYQQIENMKIDGRLSEKNIERVVQETANSKIFGVSLAQQVGHNYKLMPILREQAEQALKSQKFENFAAPFRFGVDMYNQTIGRMQDRAIGAAGMFLK